MNYDGTTKAKLVMVRFKVQTAVNTNIMIFGHVTLCRQVHINCWHINQMVSYLKKRQSSNMIIKLERMHKLPWLTSKILF
jgi:hypothetical protein